MSKINTAALRGLVFGNYKTQALFARAIAWHPNKVSYLLNGTYTPDVDEAARLYAVLSMTKEQYMDIFLLDPSPNGDI